MEPASAASKEQVTQELVSAQVADRCANCQAQLASDQRYCVNCGQRRGRTRFSLEALTAAPAPAPPLQRRRRRPKVSSSFSFILGVGVLLLAMGVGVLIGHNTNTKTTQASAPTQQVIKVEGNLGSGGPANTATKAVTPNSFKASKLKLAPKVVKKVQAAAAKVLGSSKNLSSNPTQQVGQSCRGGLGCQNGKFTGNFFSGG